MYTLNANKVGVATDNLRTYSNVNTVGLRRHRAERAICAREKLLLFGGITTDRRATVDCDGTNNVTTTPRDNPNGLRFCDATPPFRTTFKLSGAYQLPYEFQLSGTFMAIPGPAVAANYTVTAAIAGRPIVGTTAGGTTINVNLVESNSMFLDYQNKLDMRLARNFRFDRYRIQGFADIFNLLNAGTVVRVNETYGSNPATNAWMTPLTIMEGRYIRFGMQMSF